MKGRSRKKQMCRGGIHLFEHGLEDYQPDERCLCGTFSHADLDRIREEIDHLEAMWDLPGPAEA